MSTCKRPAAGLLGTLLSLFCFCAVLGSPSARSADVTERKLDFDIPAQSFTSAILVFSAQSGLQVVTSGATLPTGKTAAVTGRQTIGTALSRLLSGTGLKYQTIGDTTITLVPAQQRTSDTADPAAMPVRLARIGSGADGAPTADERATSQSSAEPRHDEQAQEQSEMVVTGTNIRGAAPKASPLTVYDREAIDRSGAATVGEFMREVPQNLPALDGANNHLASGFGESAENLTSGTSVDLRGQGAGATLVLLNGQRMTPSGRTGLAVDISMIPLSAVERIEVLSDGASALYGADAIAGVVNYVLRKNLDGVTAALRYGDTTRGGGSKYSAATSAGHSWGSGNALISYEYLNQNVLDASQRNLKYAQGFDDEFASILIPGTKSHSALLTGSQRLGSMTELSLSTYYNQRTAENSYNSDEGLAINYDSKVKQYGGVLGLQQDLGGGWQARLSANDSRAVDVTNLVYAITGESFPGGDNQTRAEVQQLELVADGPLFSVPAGKVSASIGGSYRREDFNSISELEERFKRNVTGVFTEVLVPLAPRLTLSGAARYDDYSDFGSAVSPKLGLQWALSSNFNLRGTVSHSYRAPPQTQLTAQELYRIFRVNRPNFPPNNRTAIILNFAPGNPGLQPETSTSLTFGFDYQPHWAEGLEVSMTYVGIDYKDRIARPPILAGLLFTVPGNTDIVANYLNLSPTPEQLAAIYGNPSFLNPQRIPSSEVSAIYDERYTNLASSKTHSLDLNASYELETPVGSLTPTIAATYYLVSKSRTTDRTPYASLIDSLFRPTHFRTRAGMSWSRDALASTVSLNYVSGYPSNLIPNVDFAVKSWTTVDWQLVWRAASAGLLSNVKATLNVQNVFDADPPGILSNFAPWPGYDAANANPIGRQYSLQLEKRW